MTLLAAGSRAAARLRGPKNAPCVLFAARHASAATNLKDVLATMIPKEQAKIKSFRQQHGSTAIGQITVDMVYGGMRGMKGLIYETSVLDPDEGIRFRGYSIPECQKKLPKAAGGEEPLPEGLFWLLVTGEIPTQEQVTWLSREWAKRAALPSHVVTMLDNFPTNLHPMSQLSAAVTALNSESKFARAYAEGIHRAKYWEFVYEDAMDLIAKLPCVAAKIYRNLYREGSGIGAIDPNLDWSHNFTNMLGYTDPQFIELMRHEDPARCCGSARCCDCARTEPCPVPRSRPAWAVPGAVIPPVIPSLAPCGSGSPIAGIFLILPGFSDRPCSWAVEQRRPGSPEECAGLGFSTAQSLKGPFRSQLKQLGFIRGWLLFNFVFQLPTRCFSYREGEKQDGKNSRKKGFFLNNMPPELLHGNKDHLKQLGICKRRP